MDGEGGKGNGGMEWDDDVMSVRAVGGQEKESLLAGDKRLGEAGAARGSGGKGGFEVELEQETSTV